MDTTALNIWLPVIALATVVQAVVVVIGALMIWRRIDRAETRLDAIAAEVRTELRPVAAQARAALDDVRDVAARIRRLDMQLTSATDAAARGLDHAKTAVLTRMWPAVGVVRAGAAVVRALRRRSAPRDARQEALALARFVNEGGQHG
jgi:hypothetical protein